MLYLSSFPSMQHYLGQTYTHQCPEKAKYKTCQHIRQKVYAQVNSAEPNQQDKYSGSPNYKFTVWFISVVPVNKVSQQTKQRHGCSGMPTRERIMLHLVIGNIGGTGAADKCFRKPHRKANAPIASQKATSAQYRFRNRKMRVARPPIAKTAICSPSCVRPNIITLSQSERILNSRFVNSWSTTTTHSASTTLSASSESNIIFTTPTINRKVSGKPTNCSVSNLSLIKPDTVGCCLWNRCAAGMPANQFLNRVI